MSDIILNLISITVIKIIEYFKHFFQRLLARWRNPQFDIRNTIIIETDTGIISQE